ncbi:MAG: DUF1800 domain-containing protein [Chitinophagaceae bacterium]|nr:DUF1800 domain-containing protein [Chitinophagaceae bacterium]
MAVSNQLKNQHLLWRAAFGPAVEHIADLSVYTPKEFYKALVKASERKPEIINVADNYLQGLVMGVEQEGRIQRKELTPDERREIQRRNREGIKSLNLNWFGQMVNSGAQLREKMAFFWHGHFACRNLNLFYQQGLLNVIRSNALGSFVDLLREVSHSAAMLNFLNNQQNRKGHPNENFAREVMELFTLGRGHYTEQDIKEAARAFTGWGANLQGDFVFRKGQHDTGVKTVLGQTGNLSGDDVLDILLQQRQTARFIAAKIYRFFVNDTPHAERIEWMANRFYDSNYNIGALMEDVFTSSWFYEENNIGVRIKSPIELLAGIQRMIPMALQDEESLLVLQRLLGQVLFYPPNVAGWPGGKTWIDSSTLMLRLRIPQLFNDEDELNLTPKSDDDQMMGRQDDGKPANRQKAKPANRGGMKLINANLDWSKWIAYLQKTDRSRLENVIAGVLLQTNSAVSADLIRKYADSGSREAFIRSATLQLMSTPEYQLC